MNQEKIGKFIFKKRKENSLTQEALAERLGVSNRTISNWENGKNMPDLILFKPLCEELGITINELMSGEEIEEKDYQSKLEENIVNVVNYNDKKIDISGYLISNFIGIISLIFGISYHNIDHIFPVLFELYGIALIIFGLNKLIININKIFRYFFITIVFIILFLVVEIFDINSIYETTPKYYYSKKQIGECIVYNKVNIKNIVYKSNVFYDEKISIDQIEKTC